MEVADFAQTIGADLTVVGPELPMVLGIADEFQRRGLTIFCPSRAAAEIEGSKAFAREFMQRHNIPSPRYEICPSQEAAEAFVKKAPLGYPLVIKADGLASGKGTFVVEDKAEAADAVAAMMSDKKFGTAGAKLVMEEFLRRRGGLVPRLLGRLAGRAHGLRAGPQARRATATQGPNTGGMGTVSPSTQPLRRRCTSRSCRRSSCPPSAAWPRRGASTRACSTRA